MKAQNLIIPLSILLLAVGGYVFSYGCRKIERSAGFGTSVGDDVIVIGYSVPAIATVLSALAVFAVRSLSWSNRSLPIAALVVSAASLVFWFWLHLSGVVIPYSTTLKQ
jgi:hypothetical protein